jgi:hypothetical protein
MKLTLFSFLSLGASVVAAANQQLTSPDEQVAVIVKQTDDGTCLLDLKFDGHEVLIDSPLGLTLDPGQVLGEETKWGEVTGIECCQRLLRPTKRTP